MKPSEQMTTQPYYVTQARSYIRLIMVRRDQMDGGLLFALERNQKEVGE